MGDLNFLLDEMGWHFGQRYSLLLKSQLDLERVVYMQLLLQPLKFHKQMPARIVEDLLCKLQTKAAGWLSHILSHLQLLTLEVLI